MKKMFLFAMALLLAAIPGYAQSSMRTFSVNVPFQFRAGDKAFPAGRYVVTSAVLPSGDLGTTVISSSNTPKMTALPGRSVLLSSDANYSFLRFHRYGSVYFLSQIGLSGHVEGRELPVSSAEVQLAISAPSHPVLILSQTAGR